MSMEEIWKDIEGYEGFYQASNLGAIRGLERFSAYRNSKRLLKGKILKPNRLKDGHLQIFLSKNKITKPYKVHRLVAEAFIPNPDNLPCVNHKDENPSNNNVENLEWCTQKYNVNYGTATKRRSKKVYQYTLDGELVKIWESVNDCGRNGFDLGHISDCCNGNRKKHKGFIWSYNTL